MKRHIALLLLVLICGAALAQESKDTAEPLIIEGKGWGKVILGAERKDIEIIIGRGEEPSRFNDVYFINYPAKGIQIANTNGDNKLRNVYFYDKQHGYEHFAIFPGKTDKGIDWNSSPEQVIEAYGRPKVDYKRESMRRIVFDGIDFRFENGKMVRIGIPGK